MTETKTAAAQARPDDDTPAGYMRTHTGDLRPVEMVSELDMMRDATVQELISDAKGMAAALAAFKRKTFTDIHAFAAVSAAKYGTTWGGKKGNITLTSFDGRYQVRMASSDTIAFDERLQVAKTLMDQVVEERAAQGDPFLQALLQHVFSTNKEGQLNVGLVMGLRNIQCDDPRWIDAMRAVADSMKVTGSKLYVRFYERIKGTDEYQAISLDIAAV